MNREEFSRLTLVSLLSAVLLAYQISLLQLLSYMQWSHFALLIISIAMLGYGCVGTVLTLLRKVLLSNEASVVPTLLFLSGVSMLSSVPLMQTKFFAFDSLLMFTNWREPLRFLGTALVLMLPFFFGGLIFAIYFSKFTKGIPKLYCWTMVGSGFGGVIAIACASFLLPSKIIILLSIPLFALLFFIANPKDKTDPFIFETPPNPPKVGLLGGSIFDRLSNTKRKVLAFAGFTVALLCWLFPTTITCSQFKSVSKVLAMPGAEITETVPTPNGILQKITAPALRSAPCHSLNFDGVVPVYPFFFLSGEVVGPAIPAGDTLLGSVYKASPDQVPYLFSKPDHVLILSGTSSVIHAVVSGARHIDMVEPNSILAEKYSAGFETLGNVSVHQSGKRAFLHKSKKRYDLIVLPPPNSFGGTRGLYSMNENRLLTREAFHDYRAHLSDTGIVTISWWHDYPPKAGLRLLALITTYLRDFNEDPHTHLRLIQNWGATTAVISNAPISLKQDALLKHFCEEHSFDPLPVHRDSTMSLIHSGDSLLLQGMESILSDDSSFVVDYPYRLQVPVDDRPFFNHYLKVFSPDAIKAHLTLPGVHLREQGYLVSVASVVILGLAALVLILLPLFRLGVQAKGSTLFYFAFIGCGYMFVELSLVHAVSSYLTSPLYAMSIVITSLLIGSGVGSLFLGSRRDIISQLPNIIGGILLFYTVFMGRILNFTVGAPFLMRVFITMVLAFVPGFFMGGPFPLGLKRLSRKSEQEVPWAIGINSCFSVLGAAVATLIAVELGFSGLLLVAALCYFLLHFVLLSRE